MLEIGILVGSLRKESYNRKIAEYLIRNYEKEFNFQLIEIRDFPLFNEDLEKDLPEPIIKARKQVKEKDALIFITPEYNHSISGVLKNALDWFSRDDYPMMRKPYMVMGASSGTIGTARMQGHLRQVLNSGAFQMYSMSDNEFLFARIQDNMDEEGNLTNTRTIKRLDEKMKEFKEFIQKLNQ